MGFCDRFECAAEDTPLDGCFIRKTKGIITRTDRPCILKLFRVDSQHWGRWRHTLHKSALVRPISAGALRLVVQAETFLTIHLLIPRMRFRKFHFFDLEMPWSTSLE